MSTEQSTPNRATARRLVAPLALTAALAAVTTVAASQPAPANVPITASAKIVAPAHAPSWPASWKSVNLPVSGVNGVVMFQGKALVTHETAKGYQASLVDPATGRRTAVLVSSSRIDVAGSYASWVVYLRTANSAKETRQWEIKAYDTLTKEMRTLAYGTRLVEDWGPNPSVNGNKVVWTQVKSWKGMTTNLYVHNLSAHTTRLLTSGSTIMDPCVSGNNVIYTKGTMGMPGPSRIFRINVNGGTPVPLTAASTFAYGPKTSSTGVITYVMGKSTVRLAYLRPGERARVLTMPAASLAKPLGNLVFIPGSPNKLLDPATGKVQKVTGGPGWFSAGTATKYTFVYNANPDSNTGFVLRVSQP